ncbi:MAG: NTP transferase domain-containing protein [Deltaproteobacteria bacterium]|nr:NTP transferase domain-containing protein [Deltaproteobacteria bacterium]MBW2071063.1 NTP transferase domain-containing protein [Deltaproteobacteria bacterium]
MHAVIMAGGKGTRFWPRSREKRPKQLLNITGSRSMLQQTVARIRELVSPQYILIIAGKSHGREVRAQLEQLPAENIILEPVGRNTAACIGLAALLVRKRDRDGVMLVMPADHLIVDEALFVKTLKRAAEAALLKDVLITIGIRPTAPETGYGYIEVGEPKLRLGNDQLYTVKSFHEKPNRERAAEYLRQGGFFWNSGIFIWKARTILEALQLYLPDLYAGLQKLEPALESADFDQRMAAVYPDLQSISIDYGVMEKARNVLMIPGDFGWNDVGSWAAVAQLWPRDENHNAFQGTLVAVEAKQNVVYSKQRLCVLLGVDDLIVVDSGDALLVCPKNRAQDVGKVLELLRQKGLEQYL